MNGSDLAHPQHSDPPPNSVIGGKYRLESKLAEGGMGAVWVATNLVLENRVAIKVLHREHAHSETGAARLLIEARAAAQIGHQNIVQVFDFGTTDAGYPFIVMELLQGEDLAVRLDRITRIGSVDAVRMLLPVVSAVAAAHAKGIVHRDLKPQNIYLASDASGLETPKVVDFGIAKMHAKMHTPKLTIDGRVVGSPEYLSPEQARGQDDIDARADVWALSVTLYETITGELPFADENYNRLLRRIIEDEPASTTSQGAGDEELWLIIRRGLAKNRDDRWQSASELGEALVRWSDKQGAIRNSGVRFNSQADARELTPAVVLAPGLSARDSITAKDAPPYTAEEPAASRRRGDRMDRTSPDYVRRAAWSRLTLFLAIAGVLLVAGAAMLVISLVNKRSTHEAVIAPSTSHELPSSLSSVQQPTAEQPPPAPSPPNSTAEDPDATPSAAVPPEVATAPARTPPPKPGETKAPPVRTRGSKPPPIPTEPNF